MSNQKFHWQNLFKQKKTIYFKYQEKKGFNIK